MAKRTKLDKMAKAAAPKNADELPDGNDPLTNLRLLVRQHRARDREIRRRDSAARPFILLRDKTKRENPLPEGDRVAAAEEKKGAVARQETCRKAMEKALRSIPIYQAFLCGVAGMGRVLAAYLVSEIDIHKATKPSNLKRFCGVVPGKPSVDGKPGRLEKACALTKDELAENARRIKAGERPIPGRHYCQDIRTELFKWQGQMMKSAAERGPVSKKGNPQVPHAARTNKYLTAWNDFRHTHQDDKGKGLRKGAWRATGIMLDDLYMVWRALEGLPVWPDWYAAKLGYSHGGKICVREPKLITVDEALALVGCIGWTDATGPVHDAEPVDEDDEDLMPEGDEDDPESEWVAAKGVAV